MLTEHRIPTLNQTELPVLLLWRIKVTSDFISCRRLEVFLSTQRVLIFNSKLAKENQEENKTFQNINIQNIIKIQKNGTLTDSKGLTIEYYTNHNIYKKLLVALEFPKLSLLLKFCDYVRFFRSLKFPIPLTSLQFQSLVKTHAQKMVDRSDVAELFPTTQALRNLLLERYSKGVFVPCPKVFENYTFYLVFLSKGLKDIIESFFIYSRSDIVLKDLIRLTRYLFASDIIFFRLYKQNKCNQKILDKKIVSFQNQLCSDDILKSLYFIKTSAKIRINYFGSFLYFFRSEKDICEFSDYVTEKEFGVKNNFDDKFSLVYLNKMCRKGKCIRVVKKGTVFFHNRSMLEALEKEVDELVK